MLRGGLLDGSKESRHSELLASKPACHRVDLHLEMHPPIRLLQSQACEPLILPVDIFPTQLGWPSDRRKTRNHRAGPAPWLASFSIAEANDLLVWGKQFPALECRHELCHVGGVHHPMALFSQ